MNRYELVCYERGSAKNGFVMNRSVMNVVCFEWSAVSGLLRTGQF